MANSIFSGSLAQYRERVMGCWLGKAVGGTLGVPFEGQDGPLDLHFYEPVPTEMLPNDDLDLQVVWTCILNQMEEPRVDRHVLAQAWQEHIDFPWDEYGVALRNMAHGLQPPLTGSHDNWFVHGMGAAIRSEVWACLAPGQPELAAAYAYEDACVDHAGEGVWAEVFFAALESMAFVENDPKVLLSSAAQVLPVTSQIRAVVEDTERWWIQHRNWRLVREEILEHHGHENFTDCVMNVGFTVLGWLAGEGDFSRSICIATNCGKDTDCTAATVGALMGILNPSGIPNSWLAPIGRDLVLSPGITGLNAPATLDDLTDMVIDVRRRLGGKWPSVVEPEQSTNHLTVQATMAFAPEFPLSAPDMDWDELVIFDGTVGRWPHQSFKDEYLLIGYEIHLEEDRDVRIMFNTREACRVWLDGDFLFERFGGQMAPSFHRAPPGQFEDRFLSAGTHRLVAAVRRPQNTRDAEWVVGIADSMSHQWIPGTFTAVGHEVLDGNLAST